MADHVKKRFLLARWLRLDVVSVNWRMLLMRAEPLLGLYADAALALDFAVREFKKRRCI